jgi:hypothetical protein
MLVIMRHEYHDDFRAPSEALGCPRSAVWRWFSAREDFGRVSAG